MSYRLSTVSFIQGTAPRTLTRSISAQRSRTLRIWVIIGVRLRLGTQPEHHTQPRAKRRESTVTVQANVKQLAVYVRKTAFAALSTVTGAPAECPDKATFRNARVARRMKRYGWVPRGRIEV